MVEGCERIGLVVTITVSKLDADEHVRRRRMHHAALHAPKSAHAACSADGMSRGKSPFLNSRCKDPWWLHGSPISLSELGTYASHILKSHKSREPAWDCMVGKRCRSANSQSKMRLIQSSELSC